MKKKSKGWVIIESEITEELTKYGFPEIDAETIAVNITTNIATKSNGVDIRVVKNNDVAKRNLSIYGLYLDGEDVKDLSVMFNLSVWAIYRIIGLEKKNDLPKTS